MGDQGILTKISRMFGFNYPDQLVVTKDRDGSENYIEDPDIKTVRSKDLPVLDKELTNIRDLKAIEKNIDKSSEDEDPDEDEDKKELPSPLKASKIGYNDEDFRKDTALEKQEYSLIRDRDSDKIIQSEGNANKHFKPSSIMSFFKEGALVLGLPASIVYTVILMWAFRVIDMSTPVIVFLTFMFSTLIYQGYKVYNSPIQTLTLRYKGQISDLDYYVPQRAEFLSIAQTKNKNIVNDTIGTVISYIRPILAENSALMSENNNMEDRVQKGIKIGERKVLGKMKDTEVPGPVWLSAIFILGALVGWFIKGGIAPA